LTDISERTVEGVELKIKELYSNIVRQLQKKGDAKIASKKIERAQYFGIDYKSYGIEESEEIELIRSHLNNFEQLSLEERFELAKMFYTSGFSEQANFGDAILELSVEDLTPTQYDFLDEIAGCLSNWAQTDWLCSRVVQPLLKRFPEETLNLLRKWNGCRNMWKRRASVVAFTRKIGESGMFTDEALELCNNLVWDREDLVRKGVGWALKDNMRGAKKRVLDYVKSLRRKGVSSVITLYAIRDLKGREREEILSIKPR
jgi:3-methyladenine DNA glycosylase AlkD